MDFNEYYRKEIERYGGLRQYVLAKAKEKRPLLNKVIKYSEGGKILEAGSGSSSNSIYLANKGYDVTSIDNDSKMLSIAKNLSKAFNNKPIFIKKDITQFEGKYSVVFSHGVLEHFDDEEIVKLINNELLIGKYVVISIPSDFFIPKQAITGDERFLSSAKWKDLISKSNGKIVEEFSYFYDPDNFRLKFLKILFNITKGFLPIKKPYIGFVIKNVHYS